MNELSLAELERRWAHIEAAIDATADIDRWCSGPDWIIPVHTGFGPDAETLLLTDDGPEPGFALLARYRLSDGRRMLAGLEPLWGFASPLIAPDVERTVAAVARHLAADDGWDVLVLPGMPMPDRPTSYAARVVAGLGSLGEVRAGQGMTRQVGDLGDGHEAWLARRTPRFRRNLRQANDRAEHHGVTYLDVSDQQDLFDRLLLIESRTWKGAEESGITSPDMSTTYRAMVERLQVRGRLRAHVARCDGADIGYILGGVRNGRYRGLQLSYTESAEHLSVGNLLQHRQIELLCRNGEATVYDLGMDLDYKRRWADHEVSSFTIVIERPGGPSTAS